MTYIAIIHISDWRLGYFLLYMITLKKQLTFIPLGSVGSPAHFKPLNPKKIQGKYGRLNVAVKLIGDEPYPLGESPSQLL